MRDLAFLTGADIARRAEPFADEQQFLAGVTELVDVLCLLFSQINHNDAVPYALRGQELCEEEFAWALYDAQAVEEPMPEAERMFAWWRESMAGAEETLRFGRLGARLGLSEFEQFLVLLALAPELNRKYETLFAFLQNDVNQTRPTLGLAADLYSLGNALSEEEVYASLDRSKPLNAVLFMPWRYEGVRSLLARPCGLWKMSAEYLLGTDNEPDALSMFCRRLQRAKEPLFHHEAEAERARQFLSAPSERAKLLYVYGEAGSGRRFLLSTLEPQISGLYLAELSYLRGRGIVEEEQLGAMLVSYCGLHALTPVLLAGGEAEDAALTARLLRMLKRWFSPVCVCALTPPEAEDFSDMDRCVLQLEESGAGVQERMWRYFARERGLSFIRGHEEELVSSYRLTPGQIAGLCDMLLRVPVEDLKENQEEAWRQSRDKIRAYVTGDAARRLGHSAQMVKGGFSRADLQLPPAQSAVLDFVIQAVRQRYQVYEERGFGAKLPYGRGISVLLYGPPGTGKTMTAQVLAAETGLELFKIDASKLMDKYIGETEKKLGSLFDTAEKTNAILFFDEADAFFSRRTDVSSANDRYSNAETSYLLQRLESYSGMTVLATNHSNYFDEAFRRRITYSINIPMPDEQTRLRIWEGIFPAQTQVDAGVSFAELAQKFQFSGSSIKYVALEAVYAAAIAGTKVTRGCIRTGLLLEYAKSGRMLGMSEYPAESPLDAAAF